MWIQVAGVAMTPAGLLFVICEPNLFYRLECPTQINQRKMIPAG
jgi:uncharacterized protein YjiK